MVSRFSLSLSLAFLPLLALGCAAPSEEEPAPDADAQEISTASTQAELAAAGCYVNNQKPRYDSGRGRVYARSTVSCSTTKHKLTIKTYLTRDNAGVAEDTAECFGRNWCTLEVSAPNRTGNQKWCTHGNAIVQATSSSNDQFVADAPVCETASF